MKLSIIVPVYKGENTIVPLYNKIKEALEDKFEYEVIFINDSAIDDSWSKILSLGTSEQKRVKGFSLNHNYGQHKAILFGIRAASGDYIITMDEDIQHDPKYIPEMLSYLMRNELDVVYGSFTQFKNNGARKIGSKLGRRIAGLFIPNLYKGYSPFRIIKGNVAHSLEDARCVAFIDSQLGNSTNRIGEYPIEHFMNKRPSSYSFIKLIFIATIVLITYSIVVRSIFIIFLTFAIGFFINSAIKLITNGPGLIDLSVSIVLFLSLGSILYNMIILFKRKSIKVISSLDLEQVPK